MMQDCQGIEMNIGDKVVCTSQHYQQLEIGVITKFTPKRVYVLTRDRTWERIVEPRAIAVLESKGSEKVGLDKE